MSDMQELHQDEWILPLPIIEMAEGMPCWPIARTNVASSKVCSRMDRQRKEDVSFGVPLTDPTSPQ
jgi:hypothetical protein